MRGKMNFVSLDYSPLNFDINTTFSRNLQMNFYFLKRISVFGLVKNKKNHKSLKLACN